MKHQPHRYRVIEGLTTGNDIGNAVIYDVEFASIATPHDILYATSKLNPSDIESINQVSFTLQAWIVQDKDKKYYIYQLA